jgi:two-component system, LuxR family, response regulator FixJ
MIAIVDDDESVRSALARLMRFSGFSVETFASGSAFLSFTRRIHPACVVLDVHMPGVDGWGVQVELTRTAPAVPIIIITGHGDASDRERALSSGAAAFFVKPVDASMLLAAIKAAIA